MQPYACCSLGSLEMFVWSKERIINTKTVNTNKTASSMPYSGLVLNVPMNEDKQRITVNNAVKPIAK